MPHMEQGEQETAGQIGNDPAFLPQVSEDQSAEQNLFHEGGQKHHDQHGCARCIVDLGRDGGVVQIDAVGDDQIGHPVDQFVQPV